MNISSTGYAIELSESELWSILFCTKHYLEQSEKTDHCKRFSGMQTYRENYGREIEIYRQICMKIGRPDLYDETISKIENVLKEFEK